MLRTFKNKALARLYATGKSAKVAPNLHTRILRRLDALNMAYDLTDLNVPGFDFHALHGFKPTRYSLHVNGPWCITFEWDAGDALRVDLEQYH